MSTKFSHSVRSYNLNSIICKYLGFVNKIRPCIFGEGVYRRNDTPPLQWLIFLLSANAQLLRLLFCCIALQLPHGSLCAGTPVAFTLFATSVRLIWCQPHHDQAVSWMSHHLGWQDWSLLPGWACRPKLHDYTIMLYFIHPPFRQISDFQPDRFPHFRASNLKWGSSGAVGVFPTRFKLQKHNI